MKIVPKDINKQLHELEGLSITEKLSKLIEFIDNTYGELSSKECEALLVKSPKLFSLVQSFADIGGNNIIESSGNLYNILDAYDYLRGEQEFSELGISDEMGANEELDNLESDFLDNSSDIDSNNYDSVGIYIKSLNYPTLTAEQEKELAYRIQNGDEEARDLFIKHNMRLVTSIVRRYKLSKGVSVPFLDLVQEGNLGMMKAVDRFDPSRGRKFSTYATHYIMQAINVASNSQSSDDIIFPRNFYDAYNKYKQLMVIMSNIIGREATIDEIAKLLNVTSAEVEKFRLLKVEYVSLSKTIGDDDDTQLLELIPDTSSVPIHEESEQNYLKEEVARIINTLPKRDAEIIFDFFYGEKTMDWIANKNNLTYQRVQQIIVNTLHSLRKRKDIRRLAVYLNEANNNKNTVSERSHLSTYKSKPKTKQKKKVDDVVISKLFERMKKACIDLQNNKYTKEDLIISDKKKIKK